MLVESGGNPWAISVSGAVGLMQVMPSERGYPGRPSHQALLDPATNIEWGCRILRAAIDAAGGDVWGGVARYYGLGKRLTERYVVLVQATYQRLQ